MDNNNDRLKSFTRRAFVIGAAQGAVLTVLGGRLAWLQIAEGERYKTLAENNRINTKMLTPSRGYIVDRDGIPIATNKQSFRVLITPEQTDDLLEALKKLNNLVPIKDTQIEKILQQAKKSAAFLPLEVKNNLSWKEVAKIEVNLTDLPGLAIDVGEVRNYPLNEASAHLVGYVGAVSESELTGDPVLTLPGFRIGKTGVEKAYDLPLRGTPGRSEMEVNVVGREVRELKRHTSRQGKEITLTIDSKLQNYTQERLGQTRSASAVIMDVHTGAIYSLSSHPSFDPNLFTHGISAEQWEGLLADPGFPLTNKAIAGQYPPGSTFKMVTAMAGLEHGIVNGATTVFCPGHYEYGSDKFHCWKWGGHGHVGIVSALMESCDTYFYKISTDIGIDRIAEMAKILGLGQKYDFELTEERSGLIPDKNWKIGHLGEVWRPGETIVASIGQGYIQSTPLQLAVMTSRLVNGGYAVKPWIISKGKSRDIYWPKIDFKPYHINLIKKGMNRVTTSEDGTAFGSRIPISGMEMGGKTGTAQVRRITMQQRLAGIKNEDLPWKYRHHALFVGYAPIRNPRYACSVVVEHGGGGSTAAAPIAKDLLLMAQKLDPASRPVHHAQVNNASMVPVKKPTLMKSSQ